MFGRTGRVPRPRCGAEGRSDSAESVTARLLAEHADARALVCFPLPPSSGRDPAALFPALLQRGFARVKVGADVVDLADAAGRPVAAPEVPVDARVAVVLD